MGNQTMIIGAIESPIAYQDFNRDIISKISDFEPFNSEVLSNPSTQYQWSIISFAISTNSFSDEWESLRSKFELLLREIKFLTATILFQSETEQNRDLYYYVFQELEKFGKDSLENKSLKRIYYDLSQIRMKTEQDIIV
jgi:hypothetical protein